ncbi:LysR family transcriptional regulator [Roseomonas sp. GC11]|uniref:helix-turn-helix domain-containing protein n=1 Tax=Roseomonas sp. GC11 TaxID=2950546 RepID=UPI00210ACF07|nr:LysR family transcriptional regulator [Roseomonas sp. GC11]MCQ4160519.1 LysR family transcriptional regulator [Roseomonas sp. GC11]
MMAQLEWLHSFTATAEFDSFTRAARQLNLAQAAISPHIRALEAQCGHLLIRWPQLVEVTHAGRALHNY